MCVPDKKRLGSVLWILVLIVSDFQKLFNLLISQNDLPSQSSMWHKLIWSSPLGLGRFWEKKIRTTFLFERWGWLLILLSENRCSTSFLGEVAMKGFCNMISVQISLCCTFDRQIIVHYWLLFPTRFSSLEHARGLLCYNNVIFSRTGLRDLQRGPSYFFYFYFSQVLFVDECFNGGIMARGVREGPPTLDVKQPRLEMLIDGQQDSGSRAVFKKRIT